MSGRAIQIAVVVAVAGVGALLWQRTAVDESEVSDDVSANLGSFAAQTTWGEPDIASR
jgi:hypothetical protein